MVDEYSSLTRFVRKHIVDTNLALNPLRKSTGAVASYLRHFKELGWTSTLVPNSPSHRKIITPDGKEYLTLVGGKAYWHPEVTERICKSKHVTKKFLELSGLATPAGVDLAIDEFDVAAALFTQMRKNSRQ